MSAGLTETVKDLARQKGFLAVGIASAGPVPHAEGLRDWLGKGWEAEMAYMRRDLDKRLRPDALVEGARSVICLTASYARADDDGREGLIARYARPADYHDVLRRRCVELMDAIVAVEPAFAGRAFAGSSPVMERSLAASAGLGWIGHNGCLLTDGAGSYCLLCEIVCNLPLDPDRPIPNRCGDCRACVDACPTGALDGTGLVDARKCISYLTVRHGGEIDSSLMGKMGQRVVGCDACQVVCPSNRRLAQGDRELVTLLPFARAGLAEMLTWTPGQWEQAAAGSAARRAGYERFIRNAIIAAGNSSDPGLLGALEAFVAGAGDQAPLARWAVQRLGRSAKSFDGGGGRDI